MAWAYVQSVVNRVASGANAKAYTSNNTGGNFLLCDVMIESDSATVSSLTDTRGNTWFAVGSLTGGGNGYRIQTYYAKNCGAGANTVTLTPSAAACEIHLYELSGLDTAAPFDTQSAASGASATADSGTITTAAANEYLHGFGASNASTLAAGSGWTSRTSNGFNYFTIGEEKNAPTGGSYSAQETLTSNVWVINVSAFREPFTASTRRGMTLLGVG